MKWIMPLYDRLYVALKQAQLKVERAQIKLDLFRKGDRRWPHRDRPLRATHE